MKHSYLALSIISALTLTACGGSGSEVPLTQPAQPEVTAEPKPPAITNDDPKKKPQGVGSGVLLYGEAFKSNKNINPNSRKHLKTDWNEFSIIAPNTILGYEDPDNTEGDQVTKSGTFDLEKAKKGSPKEVTISLENDKEVTLKYYAVTKDYLNKLNEKEFLAQSVHIFGENKNDPDKKFSAAYVYGKKTPDSLDGVNKEVKQGKFTYNGDATFHAFGDNTIIKGTSEFVVNFGDRKIEKAELDFSDTAHDMTYTVENISIAGKKTALQNSFETANFSNSHNFHMPGNKGDVHENKVNNIELRGYFYGDQAQALGGSFYTEEGAGTFYSER